MPGQNYGSYVGTTQVWDVSEIYATDVKSPEFKELLVRLYQNLNNMALSVNTRDAGYYDTTEFVNGQTWFSNPANNSTTASAPARRQDYRMVVNFGALPNAGTKTVAHNIPITSGYTFTRIYGAASDTTGLTYIPLPYASNTANRNIELSVGANNVTVTTAFNYSNYTVCYIIIEYLKF